MGEGTWGLCSGRGVDVSVGGGVGVRVGVVGVGGGGRRRRAGRRCRRVVVVGVGAACVAPREAKGRGECSAECWWPHGEVMERDRERWR